MAEEQKEQTNQPQQPSKDVSANPKRLSKLGESRLLIAGLIILLLAGIFAIIFVPKDKTTTPKSPYAYTYKGVSDTKLPGASQGKGISFKRPSAFGPSTVTKSTATDLGYSQYVNIKTGNKVTGQVLIARLTANSTDTPQANLKIYRETVAKSITDSSSSSHKQVMAKMEYYARQSFFFSKKINVTVGKGVAYKNSTITQNAWQFDVTVSDKENKMPTQKGKLIYVIGKTTSYSFLFTANVENWPTNASVFNQVLNSLTIDV